VNELLDAIVRLRELGATRIVAEPQRIDVTFGALAAEPDKHEQARESVRMQEARRLLDDEASELP
jgi:hypothetical protein